MRLLPSRAWSLWFPLQRFHKQKENKQQITGGRRGTGKQDARPWLPLVAALPGWQPIRRRRGAERRQPAMKKNPPAEGRMVSVTVNGQERTFDCYPSMPLMWYLRDELGLTGTKFGCGVALCGACTVHLNGEA